MVVTLCLLQDVTGVENTTTGQLTINPNGPVPSFAIVTGAVSKMVQVSYKHKLKLT